MPRRTPLGPRYSHDFRCAAAVEYPGRSGVLVPTSTARGNGRGRKGEPDMRGNATTTTHSRIGLHAAIAAAVAGAALLAFGADTAPARTKQSSAQVRSGTLTIDGDRRDGRLALRLRAGNANKLEIDFGDNGSADLTFNRNRFDEILVNAGGGDDRIRIDEVNG